MHVICYQKKCNTHSILLYYSFSVETRLQDWPDTQSTWRPLGLNEWWERPRDINILFGATTVVSLLNTTFLSLNQPKKRKMNTWRHADSTINHWFIINDLPNPIKPCGSFPNDSASFGHPTPPVTPQARPPLLFLLLFLLLVLPHAAFKVFAVVKPPPFTGRHTLSLSGVDSIIGLALASAYEYSISFWQDDDECGGCDDDDDWELLARLDSFGGDVIVYWGWVSCVAGKRCLFVRLRNEGLLNKVCVFIKNLKMFFLKWLTHWSGKFFRVYISKFN